MIIPGSPNGCRIFREGGLMVDGQLNVAAKCWFDSDTSREVSFFHETGFKVAPAWFRISKRVFYFAPGYASRSIPFMSETVRNIKPQDGCKCTSE